MKAFADTIALEPLGPGPRYSAINRGKRTGSGRNTSVFGHKSLVLSADFEQVPRIPLYDNALNEDAFAFLEDVVRYRDDGVKERYKRLGLSIGTGNRLKEQLLEQGWLETQVVGLGKTRKVPLRLSREGKQALGLDAKNPERASPVHEYWKRFYTQRLREQGYKVCLEAPRKSGNVDVVAVKNDKSIAVEIETGKSDIVKNVKQNLLSGFDKVLVMATDEKALAKIEQMLAKEGLVGLGRIGIMLRDRV